MKGRETEGRALLDEYSRGGEKLGEFCVRRGVRGRAGS